jgi:pilus assembly protein Flp/PilA
MCCRAFSIIEKTGASAILSAPSYRSGLAYNVPPREAEDKMKSLINSVRRFLVSEDGPTAVEYAVMLALIIIICITAIRSIGTNANATFETVGGELG